MMTVSRARRASWFQLSCGRANGDEGTQDRDRCVGVWCGVVSKWLEEEQKVQSVDGVVLKSGVRG